MNYFEYLNYPFVRYAFIVGVLIAVCASMIGTVLVANNMSFMGESLSRIAFMASIFAGIVNIGDNMIITLVCTCAFTVFLMEKRQNDKLLAIISVSALSLGYIAINLFGRNGNVAGDVCTVLFGSTSILTLKINDVIICIVLSIVIIITFYLLRNNIFAVTFDIDFARAKRLSVRKVNIIIALMTATIITLATKMTGSLLITALIAFPTASCAKFASGYKETLIEGIVFAAITSFLGISIAIVAGTPVGATIALINLIAFIVMSIIQKIKGKA